MGDPISVLATSTTALLVDWPRQDIPRSLLQAGLTVYGFSPNKYSIAELSRERPAETESCRVFSPESPTQIDFLVFRKLDSPPTSVDIIAAYRPMAELPGIIERHLRPLGARTLWLPEAPLSEVRGMVAALGVAIIEGVDIGAAAKAVGSPPAKR
jgi:hypothetical protein